ncbi:hypothetical protein PHAMO_540004 [Magnetospirillum molischianum DSM 120]|uniref:Uncharacterized protein n=1 Tax=Magnetospirillum molischianum DSM 120 TaxID=1150626 RepID=H8FXB5_MAGML|nr:hypothetical protein PHAMO_540004 [Magnetospirillum molischianum DSM 120]
MTASAAKFPQPPPDGSGRNAGGLRYRSDPDFVADLPRAAEKISRTVRRFHATAFPLALPRRFHGGVLGGNFGIKKAADS